MTYFKKVFGLILLFLLALLSTGLTFAEKNSEKELMILFTHDLHSYFLPHRILTEDGKQIQQGGYAKIADLISEQRKLYHNRTILVDAGDFSMGTLFHTSFMTEAFELRLMGKMGYEVTTLPAIVASNVVLSKNALGDVTLKKAFVDYPVREYFIIERNGLRIGLFGIMGKDAADDAPFAKPVTFSDPIEASRRMVEILKNKEKVDIIICLSHSGTSADKSRSEDEILARTVPQIDIIISGHTHTILKEPIVIGKTIIVSCGSYGEYLGMLKISYEKEKGVQMVWKLGRPSCSSPRTRNCCSGARRPCRRAR